MELVKNASRALLLVAMAASRSIAAQSLALDGNVAPHVYEGVGAVSGGGATSLLLKDYPEPQRSQVLDLLFKPNFGASMPTLYVEVGGDGNSTQGPEQTHARTRHDLNYFRGYEWWLMREAVDRNPTLTLDACAWAAPGWVGDGEFKSQDMADYYATWIKGLQSAHGLTLDALGVRNEKGVAIDFIKTMKRTLVAAGLDKVRLHGFDSAGNKRMWDWVPDLDKDAELDKAVDVISNHCATIAPVPDFVREAAAKHGKVIWNTEEHVYNSDGREFKDEYAVALGTLHFFNDNYIAAGATKVINWYLVGATYPIEPYADQPPPLAAQSPWSGHYRVKPALWAYAHYGQFAKIGWRYVDGGCAKLDGGGTVVTLKSPDADGDFSVIAETAGARAAQTLTFKPAGGLARRSMCVWRTTRDDQFAKQADLTPAADGTFTIDLAADAIYSISTTTGQQKGAFADVPADAPFPFPYVETFDEYADAKSVGYLPAYTADIVGVFEIADRNDARGKCLRQVLDRKANSWAPEWKPYTVIGDANWTDYEVSADVRLDNGGWAGVMGRVSRTGNGWDNVPEGYYARLYADGGVGIYVASERLKGSRDRELAVGQVPGRGFRGEAWHAMMLRFEGPKLTLLIDGNVVLTANDATQAKGMAGLITGGEGTARNTAMFDDLRINKVGDAPPATQPTPQVTRRQPLYRPR